MGLNAVVGSGTEARTAVSSGNVHTFSVSLVVGMLDVYNVFNLVAQRSSASARQAYN